MTTVGEPSANSRAFARLLLESGLASEKDLGDARAAKAETGLHVDETLIAAGVTDAASVRAVMSHAWKIRTIDLTSEWIDVELVRSWKSDYYISENWMPVRDQSNGTVLVVTAREPDPERAAVIEQVIASPVEFAVATSGEIRAAVATIFAPAPRFRTGRLARAVQRPRD